MQIYDTPYRDTADEFNEMRALLVRAYAASRKPSSWRLALLENWKYASMYSEPPEYFTSRAHLWRSPAGELVGFLIRYYRTTFLQVLPGCPALEESMLAWAEQHWEGEDALLRTVAYDHDLARQRLLAQRGYLDQGAVEIVRIYDLQQPLPQPALPPGFRFSTLAESGDAAARVDLENAVWGVELDLDWFRGKSCAPTYSADWDLLILSPGGRQAAFSLVWLDRQNLLAEIDPLGTHPEYRGRGLARALVLESFRRMRAAGCRYVYIAADAGEMVNHLYESLQPVETFTANLWIKAKEAPADVRPE